MSDTLPPTLDTQRKVINWPEESELNATIRGINSENTLKRVLLLALELRGRGISYTDYVAMMQATSLEQLEVRLRELNEMQGQSNKLRDAIAISNCPDDQRLVLDLLLAKQGLRIATDDEVGATQNREIASTRQETAMAAIIATRKEPTVERSDQWFDGTY